MVEWIAALLTPIGVLAGTTITAWFALKERRAEVSRPNWEAFTDALQAQVDSQDERLRRQDAKIDELFARVKELRSALREEQRMSGVVLQYLRRVLAWALERLPPGTAIPAPPSELSEELRDYLE